MMPEDSRQYSEDRSGALHEMQKMNCWEFKQCGREPGGIHEFDLGICPAATDTRLDGVHDGKNGGRACWVLTGTMCRGKVEGTFAQKYDTCARCDFYRKVREEEYPQFSFVGELLARLWKRFVY